MSGEAPSASVTNDSGSGPTAGPSKAMCEGDGSGSSQLDFKNKNDMDGSSSSDDEWDFGESSEYEDESFEMVEVPTAEPEEVSKDVEKSEGEVAKLETVSESQEDAPAEDEGGACEPLPEPAGHVLVNLAEEIYEGGQAGPDQPPEEISTFDRVVGYILFAVTIIIGSINEL